MVEIEEKVFGPLSFKQFIYSAIGFGFGYLAYTNLDFKISIVIIVILIGGLIAMILNSPKVELNEEYLKAKQANSKTPEEFERWISRTKAMIQAQITIRQAKGATPDPKLESMLALLNSFFPDNK